MMKCQRVSIERHHLGEGGLMGPTLVLRSPAWGLKEQSWAPNRGSLARLVLPRAPAGFKL